MNLQRLLPLTCPCGDRDFENWSWSLVVEQLEAETMHTHQISFSGDPDWGNPALVSERLGWYADISDCAVKEKLGHLSPDRTWAMLLNHHHEDWE